MTESKMHTTHETDDCLFCTEHLDEAAMRILEPDDQERVESHLARCLMCRDELAMIERSLLPLAYAVDDEAPEPSAKQALMAAVAAESKQTRTNSAPPSKTSTPLQKQSRRTPRYLPWSYGGIFAGLAVALLVAGLWSFMPFDRDSNRLPGGQIQVMAMDLTCPDCHEETGGQIGADPESKDGMVVAWNLDPQRKHEVWCVNSAGKHTKIGDLKVANTGSVIQTMSFPDSVGEYQEIYVIRDDGAQELTVAPGTNRDQIDESDNNPATPPG